MKQLVLFLLVFASCRQPNQKQAASPKQDTTHQPGSLGCILLSKEEFEALPKYVASANEQRQPLPPSAFLNSPPVGDQGMQSSCVAWGTGYVALGIFDNLVGKPWTQEKLLSPAYVYNQIKVGNCDGGSRIRDAFKLIKDDGCCNVLLMPYNPNNCSLKPNEAQRTNAYYNHLWRLWAAVAPKEVNTIKLRVANRCAVVVGLKVTKSFDEMWFNGGIWDRNYGAVRGGHCVAIVGYDDNKKMFKVQNSWGSNGGDLGFFWVTYNMVANGCFNEAYTIL